MNCRSCNSTSLSLVVDLGEHAWCNDFLTEERVGSEATYPLRMFRCRDCSLCQLDTTVSKEIMFKNHTYVSGTTKSLAKHFKEVALENINSLGLKEDDLIFDIGGNDGTQLLQYKELGYHNVINIESATNIAKISSDNGVCTINNFFNEELIG